MGTGFTTQRKGAIADADWVLTGQFRVAGAPIGPEFVMIYADTQVVNGNAAALIQARLDERATALKPKNAKKARKERSKDVHS